MTELKELKEVWKGLDKIVEKNQYEVEQLRKIVQKKSRNEIQKIKHKLLIDLVLSIVLFAFLLVFTKKTLPTYLFWYAFLFLISIAIIGVIPYLRISKLNLNLDVNLKQHLSLLLKNFEKLYKGIYFLLTPVAVVGSFLLSYFSWNNDKELSVPKLVVGIIVVTGLSLLSFFMQKYYFNWLYRSNLNRLRKLLDDLEEPYERIE